jgi:hypothetical protein
MALRDKLKRNVQPLLEPGETIQSVFNAQTGPNPYLILVTYLFFFWIRYVVVAVTDRRILVLKSSIWRPAAVKELLETFPRETPLSVSGGVWSRLQLGDRRYWVHRRFFKDVQAAETARTTAQA